MFNPFTSKRKRNQFPGTQQHEIALSLDITPVQGNTGIPVPNIPGTSPAIVPAVCESHADPTNPLGITEIFVPKSKWVYADIVFVHGLTGRSYDTWYHAETKTHWPSQLLSKDIECARLLAYGYDVDVTSFWTPTSSNRLAQHAENFVAALEGYREDTETEDRKLIFVAHSLGGLLVKKAMSISSSHPESHFQRIERLTSGIFFLGTPHRGSDLVDFPHAIARIMKAAGKRVNSDILSVLKTDSEVAADVEDWFYKWLRVREQNELTLRIVAISEELALPGDILVVKPRSARIEGYTNLSIHANHMNMTKFPPREHPGYEGYLTVRREINRLVRSLRNSDGTTDNIVDATNFQECLKSFHFPELPIRHDTIHEALQGTFDWIWEFKPFQNWITSKGIFWISGKPGSGKSTLMKYLYQTTTLTDMLYQVYPQRNLFMVKHFFDYKTGGLARSLEGLLRSILWQLLLTESDFFHYVESEFLRLQKSQTSISWKRQELVPILRLIAKSLTQRSISICIFVDALDECHDDHGEVARLLLDLVELSGSNLILCVSSRPDPDFSYLFETYHPTQFLKIHECTREDIEHFAAAECPDLVTHCSKNYSDIIRAVVDRANGVFLWVRLVCDCLRRAVRRSKSAASLRRIVKDLPSDLSDLFQRILDQIDPEDVTEAYFMLSIVAAAPKPLSPAELLCSLAYGSDLEEYEEFQPCLSLGDERISSHEEMRFSTRVCTICGGLLETRLAWRDETNRNEPIVVPLHDTVHLFLQRSSGPSNIVPTASIITHGHAILLRACTTYLSLLNYQNLPYGRNGFRFPPDGLRDIDAVSSISEDQDDEASSIWSTTVAYPTEPRDFKTWCAHYDYLWYSSENWAYHAQLLGTDFTEAMVAYVDSIGGEPFFVWREVFWELLHARGSSKFPPHDMPETLLEYAYATGCVRYVNCKTKQQNPVEDPEPSQCGRLLYAGVRGGSLELCEHLLQTRPLQFFEQSYRTMALLCSIDFVRPDMVDLFIRNGFDPTLEHQYHLWSSSWGRQGEVKVRCRDFECSPLELAITLHMNDIVQQMVAHSFVQGKVMPRLTQIFCTVLGQFTRPGHRANTLAIHLLLRLGQTLSDKGTYDEFIPSLTSSPSGIVTESPLGRAIAYGYLDVIADFLNFGANPNASDQMCSILRSAVYAKSEAAIRLLLDHGARLDLATFIVALSDAETPIGLDILQVLLKHQRGLLNTFGIDHLIEGEQSVLQIAVTVSKWTTVSMLLDEYKASPNLGNSSSSSPLHIVLRKLYSDVADNYFKIVQILLKHSARTDVEDENGRSALHLALLTNNVRLVRELVMHGAKITASKLREVAEDMKRRASEQYPSGESDSAGQTYRYTSVNEENPGHPADHLDHVPGSSRVLPWISTDLPWHFSSNDTKPDWTQDMFLAADIADEKCKVPRNWVRTGNIYLKKCILVALGIKSYSLEPYTLTPANKDLGVTESVGQELVALEAAMQELETSATVAPEDVAIEVATPNRINTRLMSLGSQFAREGTFLQAPIEPSGSNCRHHAKKKRIHY